MKKSVISRSRRNRQRKDEDKGTTDGSVLAMRMEREDLLSPPVPPSPPPPKPASSASSLWSMRGITIKVLLSILILIVVILPMKQEMTVLSQSNLRQQQLIEAFMNYPTKTTTTTTSTNINTNTNTNTNTKTKTKTNTNQVNTQMRRNQKEKQKQKDDDDDDDDQMETKKKQQQKDDNDDDDDDKMETKKKQKQKDNDDDDDDKMETKKKQQQKDDDDDDDDKMETKKKQKQKDDDDEHGNDDYITDLIDRLQDAPDPKSQALVEKLRMKQQEKIASRKKQKQKNDDDDDDDDNVSPALGTSKDHDTLNNAHTKDLFDRFQEAQEAKAQKLEDKKRRKQQQWEEIKRKRNSTPPPTLAPTSPPTMSEYVLRGSSSLGSAGVESSRVVVKALYPEDWFEDIDIASPTLGCGSYKCVFHSKTSRRGGTSTNTNRYGYIVQMFKRRPFYPKHVPNVPNLYLQNFAVGQELSEQFSIRHTVLANMYTFTIQQQLLHPEIETKKGIEESVVESGSVLTIQPIELYPTENCVLFKCHPRFFDDAMRAVQKLDSFSSSAVDPREFEKRLRFDVNQTMEMMEQSRWAPGLSNDFQLVIDVSTGSIIHIDLDRLFQKEITPVQWDECCIEELENITEYIVARKYVSTIYDDSSATTSTMHGDNYFHDVTVARITTYNETVQLFNSKYKRKRLKPKLAPSARVQELIQTIMKLKE